MHKIIVLSSFIDAPRILVNSNFIWLFSLQISMKCKRQKDGVLDTNLIVYGIWRVKSPDYYKLEDKAIRLYQINLQLSPKDKISLRLLNCLFLASGCILVHVSSLKRYTQSSEE